MSHTRVLERLSCIVTAIGEVGLLVDLLETARLSVEGYFQKLISVLQKLRPTVKLYDFVFGFVLRKSRFGDYRPIMSVVINVDPIHLMAPLIFSFSFLFLETRLTSPPPPKKETLE